MSRTADRASYARTAGGRRLALVLLLATAGAGCEALEGRAANKKGNRFFRETKFIDAVAEYERALETVDDPIIHYNLALAYSKVFKPGVEDDPKTADVDESLLLLDLKGSVVCETVPQTKIVSKQVCVKEGDKRFDACDAKNVCASSYQCLPSELCAIPNAVVADLAAQHFAVWLAANPDDAHTRAIMTQVWIDSSQYEKAIDYWTDLLKQKPDDPEVLGSLAGINLKAGKWRKSIEWYQKVAAVSKEDSAKVSAYQFIGNVAWSKLNSKTLDSQESIELADFGIGALQKAAELQPQNPRLFGLMGSIYNFRSLAHGASWAAGLDRAKAQDLQIVSRVISDEAKKAQGLDTSPASPTSATQEPADDASSSAAVKTGG